MGSREDFVSVRLTAFGEKLAAQSNGQVRIASWPREFLIKSGETKEVTRAFEWNAWLSNIVYDGQRILEIAEAPAAAE